jgi:hypothetical protein
MDKEFIKYEQALALKELGFGEECFDYYNPIEHKLNIFGVVNSKLDFSKAWIPAPLYQQAFRWFREKYRLYPIIDSFVGVKGVVKFFYKLPMYDETFDTYEESESACLDKLIEIARLPKP